MLFPATCGACGRRGAPLCEPCAVRLRPAPALPPPPGVDVCLALLAYDGPARDLVARVKYRNARGVLPGLAAALATLVEPAAVDVVTWAPTTADRRRARGFDHAELLARGVARRLARPCRPLLVRAPGPPQTGRPLAERRAGPRFAAPGVVKGSVLLVDDVVTSGATVASAAAALRAAGANRVIVVAAARTPPPRTQLHHAA